MLIKKVLVVVSIVITAFILAACTPSTDPIVVTRVVEDKVTRETEPPEDSQIEITRPAPEPTVTAEATLVPEPTAVPAKPAVAGGQPGVTYNGYTIEDVLTLDPQVAEDELSIHYTENLFVSLTNYDLETSEILPEAATSWEISEDGFEYTFHLRTDIPWVYHNPVTGETSQVIDEEGNPRFVTADDFVYGIRRACNPSVYSYYNAIIAPVIAGCSEVLNAPNPNNVSEEAIASIGVEALDEGTLVIELVRNNAHFISMTAMWTLAATPEWAIEKYGSGWIEAGTIVTNGRYVLHAWIHSYHITLDRNPFMPEDMQGSGNIERHILTILPDEETGYEAWQNNEVDFSELPDSALYTHIEDYPDESIQVSDKAVFYIGFRTSKPPFDDVHVRRAFSAAFDREKFVAEVRNGQGLPMKHFAPPGIFGAPPLDEVGVGFDPDFARAELEGAGYPSCEGFPQVTLLAYSGQSTLDWVEFAQTQWEEHLGCGPGVVIFEQMAFSELLLATDRDVDDDEAPHMFTLGWGPDYPDENNWVGDVLGCLYNYNRQNRQCNGTDTLLIEARVEVDPAGRIELFRQIEERFFGPDGEFPIMPIWLRTADAAIHSWYDYTPAAFGGDQWYNYSIDMDAKQAARE